MHNGLKFRRKWGGRFEFMRNQFNYNQLISISRQLYEIKFSILLLNLQRITNVSYENNQYQYTSYQKKQWPMVVVTEAVTPPKSCGSYGVPYSNPPWPFDIFCVTGEYKHVNFGAVNVLACIYKIMVWKRSEKPPDVTLRAHLIKIDGTRTSKLYTRCKSHSESVCATNKSVNKSFVSDTKYVSYKEVKIKVVKECCGL